MSRAGATGATRNQLLAAAAELIAEVGWGRVTTRAVAERAGLPHGAVSYHFSGKQLLLIDAATAVAEAMLPAALESVTSVDALLRSVAGAGTDRDRVAMSVLLEAMRESTRDEVLRERIAATLRRLRQRIEVLVGQGAAGSVEPGVLPPRAAAALLVAAGDGLWLHALLDPELDVGGAATALRVVLLGSTETAAP